MKMKKNKSRVLAICGFFIANFICACSSINASSHIQESVSNVERDIETTNEDSTTCMKKKTNESLKEYLDLLGTNTEDGNVNVSDQFLDNLSNVYIMGRTGTVTHAMSIESDTQIGIMEWNDNEAATEKEFEKFISLLNDYWGEQGQIGSYENMSDETYVWKDYDHSAYVACWYSNDTVKMRWDLDESVESSKEVSDLKRLMRPINGQKNKVPDDEALEELLEGYKMKGSQTNNTVLEDETDDYLEDYNKEKPQIGMTADEVLQSTWGKPEDINKSTYAWGVEEQWCYSNYRYIFFEDGFVTSIHE